MNYYVYVYLDKDQIPLYVGKGHGNRDRKHLSECRQEGDTKCPYWHNKLREILRLGERYFIVRVIENVSEPEAFDWEIWLIAHWGRRDKGTGILYNQTDGGDGASGLVQSEYQRGIMRALNADPEFAAANAERMRALNADPEFAAANAERSRERMQALHADPEFAAANAERMRALHADPEFAAANAERMRARHADPVFAAANAERGREQMQALHADPEFAAANAERGREQMRARHVNNRVSAFGELFYMVDLAKQFSIPYGTFKMRIRRGVHPEWACLWSKGKRFPDYCRFPPTEKDLIPYQEIIKKCLN